VQQPSRLRAHPRASSRASPGPPASPWPCGGSGRSAAGGGRRQRGRPAAACVRPCVRACGVCAGGWGGGREGMVGVAASAAIAAAGAGLPSPSPGKRAVELELEEEEVVRRKWPPERTEWCDPGGTSARAARRPPRATPWPRCSCCRDGSGRRSTRTTPGAGAVGLPPPSGQITVRIRRIRVAGRGAQTGSKTSDRARGSARAPGRERGCPTRLARVPGGWGWGGDACT